MHTVLKLTPRQAKFLWSVLDGALDAGACKGGLTAAEQRTGNEIMKKLLPTAKAAAEQNRHRLDRPLLNY